MRSAPLSNKRSLRIVSREFNTALFALNTCSAEGKHRCIEAFPMVQTHLVDEGHAGIGKIPFDLPHVHVLLQCTKRQRPKQLLGRKNRSVLYRLVSLWCCAPPARRTASASAQKSSRCTACSAGGPGTTVLHFSLQHWQEEQCCARTSSLFAVPGGPMSSRCSPQIAASSSSRTCARHSKRTGDTRAPPWDAPQSRARRDRLRRRAVPRQFAP